MPAKIYKAFTMIELLIVIAVLGILAVAVLSAINPIEQINRSRDTGSQSDAEQLISAIDRDYANRGIYPWQADSSAASAQAWQSVAKTGPGGTGRTAWTVWTDSGGSDIVLDKLSTGIGTTSGGTDELKASFVDRVSTAIYNHLFVYNRGNQGDSTYVCFLPKSASFKKKASDRCTAGLPTDLQPIDGTVCEGGTAPADYYWSCLP